MEEKKSGIKKFFEEFKAFAMRGNVLDMAVGVVIGGAFTAIVTALVEDIINPLIGLFFKADFSDVVIGLGGSSIKIGEFVNSIINFLIVAFVLFVVIKFVNSLHKKPEEPAEPVILEVKLANAAPLWLARLLSRHKIYMSSFSKYGACYLNHLARRKPDIRPMAHKRNNEGEIEHACRLWERH